MAVYSWAGTGLPFDPDCTLVTSHVISPAALAAFRLTIGLYALVSTIFTLIWKATHEGQAGTHFTYFTNLSYLGICVYFFLSGFQTVGYIRNSRKAGFPSYPLQKRSRTVQLLYLVLLSTAVTFPFVVTIVFWSVLLAPDLFDTPFGTWKETSFHAMNALFALLEIILSRSRPPLVVLPIVLLIPGLYVALAYIVHDSLGYYSYSFLDPDRRGAGVVALYIAGIGLGVAVTFATVWAISWLRDRLFVRKAHPSLNVTQP